MTKKKTINRFDDLVERFAQEFAKIPNFDLTQKDETANKVFNIVLYRMNDINSYKELVCNSFVPAVNKAIFDSKQEFNKSKYKSLVNVKDLDFQETLYETIRLAYVGLFHKLENYTNDVLRLSNLISNELLETEGSIDSFAKNKFQFAIKDWRQFHVTYKINWISNCVKHKDGYPLKDPKPFGFENIDETQKIKITSNEFKEDCENLIKLYSVYLEIMQRVVQYKFILEDNMDSKEMFPELYKKNINNVEAMENIIKHQINLYRLSKNILQIKKITHDQRPTYITPQRY